MEYEEEGNYHEEGPPWDHHLRGGAGGRGGGYQDRGAGRGMSERSGRGFIGGFAAVARGIQ